MVRMAPPNLPHAATAPTPAYSAKSRAGLGIILKTLLILALWAAAFIAFLAAPLLVLGAAWLVAMIVLASRHRHRAARPAEVQAPQPHRFGAAGASAEATR